MINSIQSRRTNSNKFLIFNITLMAILLNQSNIIFGLNLSSSDLFAGILLVILIIRRTLFLPFTPLMFFIITSIIVIFTVSFYVPTRLSVYAEFNEVLKDYLKIVAVFLYFIIGNNLTRLNLIEKIIKWFAVGSLIMGLIAIIFTIFNIRLFSEVLFLGGIRFKGLMNDPNYFSILQTAAVAYFIEKNDIKKNYRYAAILILIISVLISGSKTGMVTLLLYFGLKIVKNMFTTNINIKTLLLSLVIITFIVLTIPVFINKTDTLLTYISYEIPAFNRISVIFTDFNTAVNGSGSGRTDAWKIALELIKLSPIIGIGVGTYTSITRQMWDYGNIAHNTYLQLCVEWGLPLAIFFFVYVFYVIIKISFKKKDKMLNNIILRDMLMIFLIGSLAISLNNARLYWLALGSITFNMHPRKI
jgi:O-antigen ligase